MPVLEIQTRPQAAGLTGFAGCIDDPQARRHLGERQGRHVGRDRHFEEDAVAPAVLGQVDHSIGDAVPVVRQRKLPTLQPDLAGNVALEPANPPCDLAAAGTDEPGDAEDLAAQELERHVLEPARVREIAHLEHDLLAHVDRALFRGIQVLDHPANHGADDVAGGDVPHIPGHDVPAVAEDGNAVAILEDLGQTVRDVDDGDPLSGERAHDGEEDSSLALGQRGGGFIENEYPAVERQRLGDFDDLLMRDWKVPHENTGIDVADLCEPLPRAAMQRLVVHHECPAGAGRGHEDVLGDRYIGTECDFLVHKADAELLRHCRRRDPDRSSVQPYRALVRLMNAVDHVHEGRFSRPVFPRDAVDLATAQLEIHLAQRLDGTEGLAQLRYLQNDIGCHGRPKRLEPWFGWTAAA